MWCWYREKQRLLHPCLSSHSRLTHAHLFTLDKASPQCTKCKLLLTAYILLHCTTCHQNRTWWSLPSTFTAVLGGLPSVENLLQFLSTADLSQLLKGLVIVLSLYSILPPCHCLRGRCDNHLKKY